jgi:cytochrome c oxidase assembly protein subunit 15
LGAARHARAVAHPLAALVGVTALSGAYVAGMDAGRAYNTFPLMDGKWIPDEYWSMWERRGWRNFFENTAAVQFDHRVLALTTLAAVTYVWGAHRFNGRLPAAARALLDASMLATLAQVGLGISALLNHVPVSLGSLHQANALNLFTAVVGLMHVLRRPRAGGLPAPAFSEARRVATTAAKTAPKPGVKVKVKRK